MATVNQCITVTARAQHACTCLLSALTQDIHPPSLHRGSRLELRLHNRPQLLLHG